MDIIDTNIKNEVYLVGEMFRELFMKFNKLENKKHLYKDLKELTLIEINTILVIESSQMKSMSDIAHKLGVSFGTPTVTIDRLISKGYVERIRDEGDRRQVFVKLSDSGEKAYAAVIEIKNKVTEKVFGILTPEERQGAIRVMSKLNNQFDDLFIGKE